MIADPISHLIARLHLGSKNKQIRVHFPFRQICVPLLDILYQYGYIRGYIKVNTLLWIYLKHNINDAMYLIKRISKPSRRVYLDIVALKHLKKEVNYVVSTTAGYMMHLTALEKKLGGELICVVR
jgi:ribosomal protein S8